MTDFWSGPFVYIHSSCGRTATALSKLRGCSGSPEHSLVHYVISAIFWWAGSFTLIRIAWWPCAGKVMSFLLSALWYTWCHPWWCSFPVWSLGQDAEFDSIGLYWTLLFLLLWFVHIYNQCLLSLNLTLVLQQVVFIFIAYLLLSICVWRNELFLEQDLSEIRRHTPAWSMFRRQYY